MRRACAAILTAALLLTGCGGDAAPDKSAPASTPAASTPATSEALSASPDRSGGATPRPGAVQVAALGDSITAGSPLWDPDPDVRAGLADRLNDQSQYGYWAERKLDGRVSIRNCGVFGERTDQIALRLADCARAAKVIVIEGGINDIAQGRTPESAAKNLERMVQQAKRAKLAPILTEVLPWTGGYPQAAPKILRANELIQALGRRERVPVVPWYAALNDRGRMRAGLGIDDAHPSVAGYRRMGEIIAPLLERAITPDA
jgi:lysophospholipase L1-like esterase